MRLICAAPAATQGSLCAALATVHMLQRAWRKHGADGDAKAGGACGGSIGGIRGLSSAHSAGADGLSSWSPSFGARSPDASAAAGYGACSCLRRAHADGGEADASGYGVHGFGERVGGYATRVAAGHFTVAGAGWPRGDDSDEEGGAGGGGGDGGGGEMRSLAACSPVGACCTPPRTSARDD
jgi:hypothetical protein